VPQTVARAIEVLRFIAERPRTLTEVTQMLGLHKSTALRLLQTLEADGFARREDGGRYVVGFGVIPLAESAIDNLDVRTIVHPHLDRLSTEIGHTVHLAQLIDGEVVYVDKVEGRGTVAMGSRIGLPVELHTAAVAKVILAHLPEADRSRMIEGWDFRGYGPRTLTNAADYVSELRCTRERGWAEDDGEMEDYINCVALPVRDTTGRVTIGMSVTALRAVAPLEILREMVPRLRTVTEEVSADLGWRSDET